VFLWLFGILPMGRQWIRLELPPPDTEAPDHVQVRDNGTGDLIQVWDHWITIRPDGDGTLYEDRVIVQAGLLTPAVWLFALGFYAWRQWRWRRLAHSSFAPLDL
jgi:hypothetical protein